MVEAPLTTVAVDAVQYIGLASILHEVFYREPYREGRKISDERTASREDNGQGNRIHCG
jgi:hypothetical protein